MIKNQEIHDKHTGVHLAIGTHATKKDATTGQELDPRHYVRITTPAAGGQPQKISTVYFDDRGEVQRIAAHEPPTGEAAAAARGPSVGELAAQKAESEGPLGKNWHAVSSDRAAFVEQENKKAEKERHDVANATGAVNDRDRVRQQPSEYEKATHALDELTLHDEDEVNEAAEESLDANNPLPFMGPVDPPSTGR
jgi:hypothetical protein